MMLLGLAESSIQLVPDGTLFLHIAIIVIMVFVLKAILFKPINTVLEEREKKTSGRVREAREILRRVEEELFGYERALREGRAEGYRLMEAERGRAMTERQNKLSGVREEVSKSVAGQKEAIQRQSAEARTTLEKEARRLAAEIGAHILHRPITAKTISDFN